MQDELDHILGSESPIVPSDRFAADVMRAVRNEAAAPPPIPFPWRRLAIGAAATALVVAVAGVLPQLGAGEFVASLQQTQTTLFQSGAFWLAAGAVVSYVTVKLSFLSTT